MKLFFKILLGLIVIVGVAAALNWGNIQRLLRVKAMFDEDKIVHSFSHMTENLFSDPLPRSGTEHIWPMALAPLPYTFTDRGTEKFTDTMLAELDTTAFIVVKDGSIVFEEYYKGTNADDLRISWSMSKSFVSALTGLALANGDIDSLDDQVTKYVPELKGSAYDGATLRNVMNMASGIEFDEDYLDPKSDINKMGTTLGLGGSLDKFAIKQKNIARPAGEAWQYCSIDTHVIAMVLRAATGKSLQEYFVENLWSKIGASADAAYSTDGHGNAFALGGLNMRTRDYALFGELFRNGGKRSLENGASVQIIPADWVQTSTAPSAPPAAADGNYDTSGTAPLGYGYQWWVPPNSDGEYFAVGVYGQYIYVNPKAGIVIAKNAAHREFMDVDETGESYMAKNLTFFREVAMHYSDWEFAEKTTQVPPASDKPRLVLTAATSGGCARGSGGCYQTEIFEDGSFYNYVMTRNGPARESRGQIDEKLVAAWVNVAEGMDFEAFKKTLAPGKCAGCYDGIDYYFMVLPETKNVDLISTEVSFHGGGDFFSHSSILLNEVYGNLPAE